ncbi:MAG: amino acid ABC transporter permease [Nocardioidaceae bacterium]
MNVVIDNFSLVVEGFEKTLWLLLCAGVIAFVVGTVLVSMRVSPVPIMRGTGTAYITIFRNTPLLLVLFLFRDAFPQVGFTYDVNDYFNFFFVAATVGLGLYTAAFVCEALRSGINSIPVGQAEAARSIGMTFGQSMTNVILPQAFRAVIPPLANTYISLAKNTSVALAAGVTEASFQMSKLRNNHTSDQWWIIAAFALGYMVIVWSIAGIARLAERRARVST